MVVIKGDQARLLSVAERTRHLFGKDQAQRAPARPRQEGEQLTLFEELETAEKDAGWGDVGLPPLGATTLDRVPTQRWSSSPRPERGAQTLPWSRRASAATRASGSSQVALGALSDQHRREALGRRRLGTQEGVGLLMAVDAHEWGPVAVRDARRRSRNRSRAAPGFGRGRSCPMDASPHGSGGPVAARPRAGSGGQGPPVHGAAGGAGGVSRPRRDRVPGCWKRLALPGRRLRARELGPRPRWVAYALWKVLCIRHAPARGLLLPERAPPMHRGSSGRSPTEWSARMALPDRERLSADTLVFVGSRSESDTFPYGFFQAWCLNRNLGRFETFGWQEIV